MTLNDVLLFCLPSLITGGLAYVIIQKFMQKESEKHLLEVRKENIKLSLPIRLQAYERLLLLLERMDPAQVVNRLIKPGMTSKQIQLLIITTISEEFNHNITQQVYVSNRLWQEIKQAKDDSIKLVSITATKVDPKSEAITYSRKLIEVQNSEELYTTQTAIQLLKKEIKTIF